MTILFPNPVLHKFSMDYSNSEAYKADIELVSNTEINVRHVLERGNLVEQLVSEGKGNFFATVVIKKVMFRKTFFNDFEEGQAGQPSIDLVQKIRLPQLSSDFELNCHAGVCLKGEKENIKWAESTGIVNITGKNDFEYHFPKYCLLASSGWWKILTRMDGLFQINPNKEMVKGEFKVSLIGNDNRLKIVIDIHPELAEHIKSSGDNQARTHVICTAFAQALQELQDLHEAEKKGSADEDNLLEYAEVLKLSMKENGWPTWEEEGFNPSLIASKLKNVAIPQEPVS